MTDFTLDCHQNEYLAPGADHVGAIITVTAPVGDATGALGADQVTSPGDRTEIIMIDVSGSMAGPKIRHAAKAAAAAVDCIDDGVRFALIAGNHQAWRLYPSAPGLDLAVASAQTRAEARTAVTGLRAEGGTAIGAWLSLATGLLVRQDRGEHGINHAVLLTDGRDESESPADLQAALDAAAGRFQCDCRGVGTDFSVPELRMIADTTLGSLEMVAEPDALIDDFTGLMDTSMKRAIGQVDLRLWTPLGASVTFVKQVMPTLVDLTEHRVEVDARTADYPTGAWGDESRDYQVSIQVTPGAVDDEVLAGRVTLLVDGEPSGQALVRAIWTDDSAQSTRINPEWAHYTGQAELAELIQDGLEALRTGDLDVATAKLGPAVRLADASGNAEVAAQLAKVVDVEDAATGKVRPKRKVDLVDQMGLDVASTKTSRVPR